MNEEVKIGDRVMLVHMEGEVRPRLGSEGQVVSVSPDPFENDNQIIGIKWDMGSTLNILSKYDVYKIVKRNVNEQNTPQHHLITKNADIIKSYDLKFLKEYLNKIRESGAINMFGAGDWLFAGKDHLERYHGEGREDNESFQEVLDMADESRQKIISGTMKFLESKGLEVTPESVSRAIKNNMRTIIQLWMIYLH